MNLCFVMGCVVDEVKFDFILNGKNDSIVNFKIKLLNDSEINVKAYDEVADYCYRKLNTKDVIFIKGELDANLDIIAEGVTQFIGDNILGEKFLGENFMKT